MAGEYQERSLTKLDLILLYTFYCLLSSEFHEFYLCDSVISCSARLRPEVITGNLLLDDCLQKKELVKAGLSKTYFEHFGPKQRFMWLGNFVYKICFLFAPVERFTRL